jgi:hypothetical protein
VRKQVRISERLRPTSTEKFSHLWPGKAETSEPKSEGTKVESVVESELPASDDAEVVREDGARDVRDRFGLPGGPLRKPDAS